MVYLGPARDAVHMHGLTLSKILELYVETPATGQPEPILWKIRPNLGFPCTYVLNKPKQRKGPLFNSRTEKAIGVDLRGSPCRVLPEKDHRSVGIAGKLACVPIIFV